MDDIATRCVMCGGYIHAGSYPPVCSEYCKAALEIEIQFNKWVEQGMGMVEKDDEGVKGE